MLHITPLTRANVGGMARYYGAGVDDYYRNDAEALAWHGRGAALLGLDGRANQERVMQLMAGEIGHDHDGTRKFSRHDSKQRLGIDLTFSAPKSISLQALVHGDRTVLEAHDAAVAKALQAAEGLARARVKRDGRSAIETTSNLVIAKYRHETNRSMEPQLHTHAVVMNLTRRADGQWRTLHNEAIFKQRAMLDATYHSELALNLRRAGYTLRHERNGRFELAHIDRKHVIAFSSRTSEIDRALADQGLTRETATSEQRQAAALGTRKAKARVPRERVWREWRDRAERLGIDFERRVQGEAVRVHDPAKAVAYAIRHLSEREAIFGHDALILTASEHARGRNSMGEIVAAVRRMAEAGTLIREEPRYAPATGGRVMTRTALIAERTRDGKTVKVAKAEVAAAILAGQYVRAEARYTTPAALGRERAVLRMEREGRGAVAPIAREVGRNLDALNPGQRQAAAMILSSPNRIMAVQGRAGTGKTHMLRAAVPEIEAAGFHVHALAAYGQPVKDMREAGLNTRTLQSFLASKRLAIGPQSVLILDEAGVVPARLMERFLAKAEANGARVVLIGDTRQTKAIEAGKPFAQLLRAGMETVTMDENQRQRTGHMRDAVAMTYDRKSAASLEKLDAVTVIRDQEARWRRIADDYMALPAEKRDQTLVIAGTNGARRAIADHIREAEGTAGTGRDVTLLGRVDTTQAQRGFANQYQIGQIIQPERDYKRQNLARGELYRVTTTGPGNTLTVQDRNGRDISFSPYQVKQISVYEPHRAELAPGDRVRVTRNDAGLNLTNGDRFTVRRIDKGELVLSDGKRVVRMDASRALHLDYAHTTTVHAAQGVTRDHVMIEADSRSRTTRGDVYLVAISRARDSGRLYTDDLARTAQAIGVETPKLAALEMRRERQVERKQAQREERGLGL